MDLFAGIRVTDYATARPWYERLLGAEPSFEPHDTECVWELAEHRFVYIVEDPDRAGRSVVFAMVDDLDAREAAIAERGIEPVEREAYENGVRKLTYRDADGNDVAFGGMPGEPTN